MRWNTPIIDMDKFSLQQEGPYINTLLEDQTSLDISLCDKSWAKKSTIDDSVEYLEAITTMPFPMGNMIEWDLKASPQPYLQLTNSDSVVGIALNGVLFFAATSEYGYDAYFPQAFGNRRNPRAVEVDICLGSSLTFRTYRYYMFSPCIFNEELGQTAQLCRDDSVCSEDVRVHAATNVPENLKSIHPIGIARDGRVIYGPFNSLGELW